MNITFLPQQVQFKQSKNSEKPYQKTNKGFSNVSFSGITEKTLNSDLLKAYFVPGSKISFGRQLTEGKRNHVNYLGAHYLGNNKAVFRVYAPNASDVNLQLTPSYTDKKYWEEELPKNCRVIPMKKVDHQVYEALVDNVQPSMMYRFELNASDSTKSTMLRKDPRSFSQPNDTLGWSALYDQKSYKWSDNNWLKGKDPRRIIHTNDKDAYGIPPGMILEELHLGVLGGYEKAKSEIDKIAEEGVCNSVLVMPTGEFFGDYNWGYDELDKFAPESSRGTPDEFKAFVDYAHKKGINVILDVVPNHFGSEGCVVQDFGKAFAERETGWGTALNFSSEGKDYMRDYMTDMTMHWLVHFHLDGLRFDAVHELHSDATLKYMAAEIRNHPETAGSILIPEDVNKSNYLTRALSKGEIANPENTLQQAEQNEQARKNIGFDSSYVFDFRNTLLAILTGWQLYDCPAEIKDLETEFKQGYRYYNKYEELQTPKATQTLIYPLSHDELNSFGGLRIIPRVLAVKLGLVTEKQLFSPDGADKKPFRKAISLLKGYLAGDYSKLEEAGISKEQFEKAYKEAQALNRLALATVFLHPGQKMLFMGDQRGELAPFNFNATYPEHFIYQGDDKEFDGKPLADYIGAQKGCVLGKPAQKESQLGQKSFSDSTLKKTTLEFSRALKKLMLDNPALNNGSFDNLNTRVYGQENILQVHRYENGNEIIALLNFGDAIHSDFAIQSLPEGEWCEVLNSNDTMYGGNGSNLNPHRTINTTSPCIDIPGQSVIVLKKMK